MTIEQHDIKGVMCDIKNILCVDTIPFSNQSSLSPITLYYVKRGHNDLLKAYKLAKTTDISNPKLKQLILKAIINYYHYGSFMDNDLTKQNQKILDVLLSLYNFPMNQIIRAKITQLYHIKHLSKTDKLNVKRLLIYSKNMQTNRQHINSFFKNPKESSDSIFGNTQRQNILHLQSKYQKVSKFISNKYIRKFVNDYAYDIKKLNDLITLF